MILPIVRREVNGAILSSELHPVIDRIYRSRHVTHIDDLEHGLKGLLHFNTLKGMEQAATILATGIELNKRLVIVGDFDADGATSTAVCLLALRMMGYTNVDFLVPNRFDFGYGLSVPIVDVAAQQGADIIITVDNGIACIDGVTHAKNKGIEVVVTDHHLPGEILPPADAIVNPNQPGCDFKSKHVAGVGVAFYIMLALKAELQQRDYFANAGIQPPNLASLLDIVAVGTVADVVTLDKNNRILVHQGLVRAWIADDRLYRLGDMNTSNSSMPSSALSDCVRKALEATISAARTQQSSDHDVRRSGQASARASLARKGVVCCTMCERAGGRPSAPLSTHSTLTSVCAVQIILGFV